MRYVCINPPGGGGGERNPYQLIDYKRLHKHPFNVKIRLWIIGLPYHLNHCSNVRVISLLYL